MDTRLGSYADGSLLEASRLGDGFEAVAGSQLSVGFGQVTLDGADAKYEVIGDFAVRLAHSYHPQDFDLAG